MFYLPLQQKLWSYNKLASLEARLVQNYDLPTQYNDLMV